MSRPVRTCLGCRGRDDKSALVRFVAAGRSVRLDPASVLPGRGGYLHRRSDCVTRAARRRVFGRALRCEIDAAQAAEDLTAAMGALT